MGLLFQAFATANIENCYEKEECGRTNEHKIKHGIGLPRCML